MNKRIQVNKNQHTIRIGIAAEDHRMLSAIWMLISLSGVVVFITHFHNVSLPLVPLWFIWMSASAAFMLQGINSWQWSSRGVETFEILPQYLTYSRHGAIFDTKSIRIETKDIDNISILQAGIGDNRLMIASQRQRIYCGRNLSKDEGSRIRELLLTFQPADLPSG